MLPLLTLLACLTSPADYKELKEAALDHDQDGYASAEHPEEGGDDCDDERAETFPGAVEGCDGLDNDCDGAVDEGVTELDGRYHDRDRDGYGGEPLTECPTPAPEDMSEVPGDCDDNNGAINPLATDVVEDDGRDQNCDGVDGTDGDGDGFASVETGGTDCDDMNVTAYLGAEEVCFDLVDNDCDSHIDVAGSISCVTSGMLSITEFNVISIADHPLGEWIETTNTSTHTMNMYGLEVSIINSGSITPSFRVNQDILVPPNDQFVICFSDLTTDAACDWVYGDDSSHSTTDTGIPNLSFTMGSITISTDIEDVSELGYIVGNDATFPSSSEFPYGGYSFEYPFNMGKPEPQDPSIRWCRNTTDVYYSATEDGTEYHDYGTPGAPNTCTKE